MTELDAAAMAAAQERALDDIPNVDALSHKLTSTPNPQELWGRAIRPGVSASIVEQFSGPKRELFRGLIAHLREPGGLFIC